MQTTIEYAIFSLMDRLDEEAIDTDKIGVEIKRENLNGNFIEVIALYADDKTVAYIKGKIPESYCGYIVRINLREEVKV